MSKSRHNNKWFDADDYEYERGEFYSYGKKKNRYDEVDIRRQEKRNQRDKSFAVKDNDDWD